ncbi:hypothetical protein BD413DRAFT_617981 [Trametes elegans]|nr:hypothetical protein BD413DRAFT_617981 [Trametes elegans]
MGYSPDTHAAGGPSSLPASLPDLSPVAVSSPRMPRQRPPSTPYSPYSPFSTDSSIRTPSSGSAGIRHQQTFELPDPSPTDTSPAWPYPSPSPAPHTPASLRDASVPPSVVSESSPFLGLLLGDFSPEMSALDGDGAEFSPLSPDGAPVAAAMLPNFHGRPRSQSAAQFIGRGGGGENALFSSVRASQSSISVPELEGLHWPPGIFGLDSSPLTTPDSPGQEEPAPRSGARSPRSPRRASGF